VTHSSDLSQFERIADSSGGVTSRMTDKRLRIFAARVF
jgi:hypothetical protein